MNCAATCERSATHLIALQFLQGEEDVTLAVPVCEEHLNFVRAAKDAGDIKVRVSLPRRGPAPAPAKRRRRRPKAA